MSSSGTIDAVTLEVLRNGFEFICEEMSVSLIRTSYSPNIKERQDCSCALFDPNGELLAQAENLPVHLGAMPHSVAAALGSHPPQTLEPGDSIVLNDPYEGGAHLPDLTLVTPIFADKSIIGYAATRAHHADIGGATAGSVGADSTEIYQEGLRLPPVKLQQAGEPNQAVYSIIEQNVRTPEERRGDLRAQIAANTTGVNRVKELLEDYSQETLLAGMREVQAYSERRMEHELEKLPNSSVSFEDVLDSDGQGASELKISATLTLSGNSITVDFSGSAAQTAGPINAVEAVTVSATYFAIRAVTDPDIPPNAGCYRPISITAPEGTIVNPHPPAAVVGGNLETSQRITDVVLGAFAKIAPDRSVAGCQGTMNNITFGGMTPDGHPFTFYETQAGGFGGRANADGMDAVHVHMSNTLNTPIEVIETVYPLVVEQYALRPDTGGPGRFRGGVGLRRDISVEVETVCSVMADRHTNPPYGIEGGLDGGTGEVYILSDDQSRQIPEKSTHHLVPGDTVSIRTPGGGGYGNPHERDPQQIEADLEAGLVTVESAEKIYGYSTDTS